MSYHTLMHFRRLDYHDDGASVLYSTAGGRNRYAAIQKGEGKIKVSIYGHVIAILTPDSIQLSSCGQITPSTADAIRNVVLDGRASVTRKTPGSRGGKRGPWTIEIHAPGFEPLVLPASSYFHTLDPHEDPTEHVCDDACRAAQARSREVMG